MVFLRRILKILAILLWLPLIGVFSFFMQIGGWSGIKRVSYCTRVWGYVITKIFNIKIKVYGNPADFKGGLIVSNHLGYLDPLVHSALFPVRFAPKKDIRSWPVLGWYLSVSHPIWVDRSARQKSKELEIMFEETIAHDIPLLIYPEGTSSSGEEGILRFKSTSFESASEINCPILPLITTYNKAPDGKLLAWYGDEPILSNLWRVLGYKKIYVEVRILPIVMPERRSRKELAEYVHQVMEKEYWKVKNTSH